MSVAWHIARHARRFQSPSSLVPLVTKAQFGAQSLERGDFRSVAARLARRERRMEATITLTRTPRPISGVPLRRHALNPGEHMTVLRQPEKRRAGTLSHPHCSRLVMY